MRIVEKQNHIQLFIIYVENNIAVFSLCSTICLFICLFDCLNADRLSHMFVGSHMMASYLHLTISVQTFKQYANL